VTDVAVRVDLVTKRFGDVLALDAVDLIVRENEFVSLLGPSGCGKTTLLRIVAGFEQPTSGSVAIRGVDVTRMPPHRRPTNIVFQRGALFPHMDVAANIGYSLKLRGWSRARIGARVEEMLRLVRLVGLGSRGPTELSGGQIQRVALARALAAEPSVLLLDEPLSALDLKLRQHMQLELRSIQRTLGSAFLYVTHDQTEALVMSDRIAIMNQGHIVQEGTPREIYTRPASVFASDFIGETNLVQGTVSSVTDGSVTISLAGGATLAASSTVPIAIGSAATLSVRPESIRVQPASAAPPGALVGSVRELVYMGSHVRLEVEHESGVVLWAALRDDEATGFSIGDLVTLTWTQSSASIWAESTEPAASQEDAT
jgi:spermidine/putrescine ABC transporter ATP-binding subunit